MYSSIIRPLLFCFDPEGVHRFTLFVLKKIRVIPGVSRWLQNYYLMDDKRLERKLFGLTFKNPVGLAAGFDKDAKYYNELADFGFGFIETGTLTPLPQKGNPKKRLFRLARDKGIINRMGFNNEGVDAAVKRLKKRNRNLVIGGNIGKNKTTPNDKAVEDYGKCFDVLFDYVDYFVVNVSSPNTPDLRELQNKAPLRHILNSLQQKNKRKEKPKPILLKIAPDLNDAQLIDIIELVNQTKIAGVIATNTTIERKGLKTDKKKLAIVGSGGLSGKPLAARSTEVIRFLAEKSGKSFPIIGVGGIHSPEEALEKLEAGADLVQLYTGFVYEGPALVKKINKSILTNS